MQALSFESISIDEIQLPILTEKNIGLSVLRLDKIHPVISGNKWFKLKYYLNKAKEENKNHLATFGGAYSNHIIATAAAGKIFGYKTTGIIRGEKPKTLSHTLSQATELGMELFFVSREDYREGALPAEVKAKKEEIFFIDEGGYGLEGSNGASEILNYCKKETYSHIVCAIGTSTMMAGLIKASSPGQKVIGISVLKNNTSIENDLLNLLSTEDQTKGHKIVYDYHFGGYAKYSATLIDFMNEFYMATSVPSDFVYTGKIFFGVNDMIKNDSFPPGSKILIIHSGGLQGNLSLQNGTLIF
jgi:1-aminocyclopropane-1-carboxylate deaminase